MRQAVRHLWKLLRNADSNSGQPRKQRRVARRLELLPLEDRLSPSASTLGMISGIVAVDPTGNGPVVPIQGIQVTLTSQAGGASQTATSDVSGAFLFRSLAAGTYQVSASPGDKFAGGDSVSQVTVVAGQTAIANPLIGGLGVNFISLSQFLASTTQADFPLDTAGAAPNNAPFLKTALADITLATNKSQFLDLAAFFADADFTNSRVQFTTSKGVMNVDLLDSQAPQTVANFFDYLLAGRYDGTIYHRLDTSPPVLQGGGFGYLKTGGTVTFPTVDNAADPKLQNEFSADRPNVLGSLAMAKMPGDPNSATSQFYFNLANNASTLGPANNGGFTVFGALANDATTQATFDSLQTTGVQNKSATNSAFNKLPLVNYSTAGFPNDTTPANFLNNTDLKVLKRDEFLTYSATSSNSGVVSVVPVSGHPEVLSLQATGVAGTATITVTATDQSGASVQASFQITVLPLAITVLTDPITAANQATTIAAGTAAKGASISVTATDGITTTAPVTTTADATTGNWSVNVNASTLANGPVTYTVTTTDGLGHTAKISQTVTKTP